MVAVSDAQSQQFELQLGALESQTPMTSFTRRSEKAGGKPCQP